MRLVTLCAAGASLATALSMTAWALPPYYSGTDHRESVQLESIQLELGQQPYGADGQATYYETTQDAEDSVSDWRPSNNGTTTASGCFPALDFKMPKDAPSSLDGWWCDAKDEYAFLGFSYANTICQSVEQMTQDFSNARNTYKARYVRLYGTCDRANFYDDVVSAAWAAGIGVSAIIWFGFDSSNAWQGRRDALASSLRSNPKAPFVTRVVQFGSEPLFDAAIAPTDLANEIKTLKRTLADLRIPVTISELAYGFQSREKDGSRQVLGAVDRIDAHMLPFFASDAQSGKDSWHNNMADMQYFLSNAGGKKIYWAQNGWPHTQNCPGVCANSPLAVASSAAQQEYYDMLEQNCAYFRDNSIGWFAHIYNDPQALEYGILNESGQPNIRFQPSTTC